MFGARALHGHAREEHTTRTCIVRTPSSWDDSVFIWSARTRASSRMENSVSAPQYPQKRAEQTSARLQEKANNPPPPWNRRCLSQRAARVFGVEPRGESPVRLAMMAVPESRRLFLGRRKAESLELVAEEKKKLQGGGVTFFSSFFFTTSQR